VNTNDGQTPKKGKGKRKGGKQGGGGKKQAPEEIGIIGPGAKDKNGNPVDLSGKTRLSNAQYLDLYPNQRKELQRVRQAKKAEEDALARNVAFMSTVTIREDDNGEDEIVAMAPPAPTTPTTEPSDAMSTGKRRISALSTKSEPTVAASMPQAEAEDADDDRKPAGKKLKAEEPEIDSESVAESEASDGVEVPVEAVLQPLAVGDIDEDDLNQDVDEDVAEDVNDESSAEGRLIVAEARAAALPSAYSYHSEEEADLITHADEVAIEFMAEAEGWRFMGRRRAIQCIVKCRRIGMEWDWYIPERKMEELYRERLELSRRYDEARLKREAEIRRSIRERAQRGPDGDDCPTVDDDPEDIDPYGIFDSDSEDEEDDVNV
jgi:hypothetical protein